MASDTPPTPADLTYPGPKPPAYLFRPIVQLSDPTNLESSVYLCFPRKLPSPSTRSAPIEIDSRIHSYAARCFKEPPTESLFRRIWLLRYALPKEVLLLFLNASGCSALSQEYVRMLTYCVIVKTALTSDALRREEEALDHLCDEDVKSALYVGSNVASCQFHPDPRLSWLCLRPVFGRTLAELGAILISGGGGIPSWFVAHVFIGLLGAVEFLHENDLVHGSIRSKHVMLNIYPSHMDYRFREYPGVQLIDFSRASSTADASPEEDVKSILSVIEEVFIRWSDIAGPPTSAVYSIDDARIALLKKVYDKLDCVGDLRLETIKSEFLKDIVKMRKCGPEELPHDFLRLLHADLANEREMDLAMREPIVLKFQDQKAQFRFIAENRPVIMGSGGCAGMRSRRTLVARFTAKKSRFLEIVREHALKEATTLMDKRLVKN